MTKEVRNVPHAEIKAMWLLDSSLTVEIGLLQGWTEDGISEEIEWFHNMNYRLVKKYPANTSYVVAYEHEGSWYVEGCCGYLDLEDFYKKNPEFKKCKAEIIKSSAVETPETFRVVCTSYAQDNFK